MTTRLLSVTFAALMLLAAGCENRPAGKDKENKGGKGKAKKDIVDTAAGDEDFSTLVKAVKAADLAETLKGKGPFTVFAPNDSAFDEVDGLDDILKDKDTLKGILLFHVIKGKKVLADDVADMDGEEVETAGGQKLKIEVDGDEVKVGGATVTKTDIMCSNGVIHVIDAVLVPKK